MRFFKVLLAVAALGVVIVPNAMAFRFDDASRMPPTGQTGQSYYHRFQTVAGCKGVSIRVSAGSLPPGLVLAGYVQTDEEGSNWHLEGTPTVPGEYTFELELTNLCPPDRVQEVITVRVVQGLVIQQAGLPVGTAGAAYPQQQLTAAGGGNQSWTIVSGALPTGLTLSASGLISGTPTEVVQSKPVRVAVVDGGRRSERVFEVSVRAPLVITHGQPTPPVVKINAPFTYGPLATTGGSANKTWSDTGALPTGLTFQPTTGAITGTPTAAGVFPIVLKVTDDEGRAAEQRVSIQVASPVSIVTKRFAALKVGRFYTLQIKTKGGVPIVRGGIDTMNWKIVSGKLPLGLRLNTRTGKLIGTAREDGVYRFRIQVQDRFKSVSTVSYVLTVKT